jgi:putative tryptophan/tyrosine transport system substrate-binding protein
MGYLLRAMVLAGIGVSTIAVTNAAETKKVAISMIIEVPQLVQTKDGVLAGLAEKGFEPGRNLSVEYQTANGNMPTQQQIAHRFVG